MNPDTIELTLSIEEVNLILESLGELPFRRVFQLIGRIQASARAQMPLAAAVAEPVDGEATASQSEWGSEAAKEGAG